MKLIRTDPDSQHYLKVSLSLFLFLSLSISLFRSLYLFLTLSLLACKTAIIKEFTTEEDQENREERDGERHGGEVLRLLLDRLHGKISRRIAV